MSKTIKTANINAFFKTLARAEVAFRKGNSRVKFERKLPVFVALQRKAAKIGIALDLPSNQTTANKAVSNIRTNPSILALR